jgi:hypothetical protein
LIVAASDYETWTILGDGPGGVGLGAMSEAKIKRATGSIGVPDANIQSGFILFANVKTS